MTEARVERFVAMGTRVELHQFGSADPNALMAARRAIEAVDDALTIHRPSATTALNEHLVAGRAAMVTNPLLLDALIGIATAWSATGGLFDPTVGAGGGPGAWQAVTVDRAAARVSAAEPVAFDFGGFGKGFALDRAVEVLRAGGATCAFLSAGESSIAVIGGHPLGGAWQVAIPHPSKPDRVLVELDLTNAALSVSATVGPGVTAPGRSPLIRPTDGTIITTAATSIAVAASGAAAEAMSTALLVADDATSRQLIAAAPAQHHKFTFADDLAPLPL